MSLLSSILLILHDDHFFWPQMLWLWVLLSTCIKNWAGCVHCYWCVWPEFIVGARMGSFHREKMKGLVPCCYFYMSCPEWIQRKTLKWNLVMCFTQGSEAWVFCRPHRIVLAWAPISVIITALSTLHLVAILDVRFPKCYLNTDEHGCIFDTLTVIKVLN